MPKTTSSIQVKSCNSCSLKNQCSNHHCNLPKVSLFFRTPILSGLLGWIIVFISSSLTFSTSRWRYSNWYSSLYEKEYRAGEDWVVVLTRSGDVINLA